VRWLTTANTELITTLERSGLPASTAHLRQAQALI
jgi:hypothetical protein